MIMLIIVGEGRKDCEKVLNVVVRQILQIGFVTVSGCRITGGEMFGGGMGIVLVGWLV